MSKNKEPEEMPPWMQRAFQGGLDLAFLYKQHGANKSAFVAAVKNWVWSFQNTIQAQDAEVAQEIADIKAGLIPTKSVIATYVSFAIAFMCGVIRRKYTEAQVETAYKNVWGIIQSME